MKLFFDEVEKEKQTKVLYEKNKSWFAKQVDGIKEGIFNMAGFLYGTSIKPEDLTLDEKNNLSRTSIVSSFPRAETQTQPSHVLKNIRIEEREEIPTSANTSSTLQSAAPQSQEHLGNESANSIKEKQVSTSTEPLVQQEQAVQDAPALQPSTPDNAYGGTYKGASGTGGSGTPTTDTTPPDISITVAECSSSYSSSGCVVSETALTVQWASTASDFSSYDVTCTVGGSACSGFPLSATIATSTILTATDNKTYTFTATARDTTGNTASASKIVEVQTRPIVINEVGWAGTSSAHPDDEWIELYNQTSYPVDISQMKLKSRTDNKPNISLSGTIAPKSYYLIERSGSESVFSDITSNLVKSFGGGTGAGLANTGEILAIEYKGAIIDQTPEISACGGWCGGSDALYASMERIDPDVAGDLASNWASNDTFVINGKDADNLPVKGTPGKRNSVGYHISQSGIVSQDTILTEEKSPYTIVGGLTVQTGATLTIQEGVVIKFVDNSSVPLSLTVHGGLNIQGTSEKQVVFTSFKDDAYGGDLNNDGSASSPQAGDWDSIVYKPGSSGSIDYALVRYGGRNHSGNCPADTATKFCALLMVDSVSPEIKNSVFEYGATYGIRFKNSSSVVSGNTIRNITAAGPETSRGVWSEGGALTFSGNTVSSNALGFFAFSGAADSVTNNIFTNNTGNAIRVTGAYPTFSGNSASGNGLNGIGIQGLLSQSHTFSADSIPYVIEGLTTAADTTLTIPAGTIVKFKDVSSLLTVNGLLNVNGSAENRVTFTSLAETPQPGDWGSVIVTGTGTSTVSYADFLYGGKFNNGFPADYAALKISNGSVSLSNSTFQNNDFRGLWLSSSNGSEITNATFAEQNTRTNSSGIHLENSSATLGSLTITGNSIGVDSSGGAVTSLGGSIFSGNTADMNPSDLFVP